MKIIIHPRNDTITVMNKQKTFSMMKRIIHSRDANTNQIKSTIICLFYFWREWTKSCQIIEYIKRENEFLFVLKIFVNVGNKILMIPVKKSINE